MREHREFPPFFMDPRPAAKRKEEERPLTAQPKGEHRLGDPEGCYRCEPTCEDER